MKTLSLNNKKIELSFKKILTNLPDKERVVLKKRTGFGTKKLTLQDIGESFSPKITRERVRQIENSGIKKIGKIIKSSILSKINITAKEFLEIHSGLTTKEKIINYIIKELQLEEDINVNVLEAILQSDYEINKSKPKHGTKTYFFLPSISKDIIDKIYKEGIKILKKRRDVMDKIDLYEQIKFNLHNNKLTITFIDSVLDVYNDIVSGENNLIGLEKWKILNPKTLKDKAIYILRKEKVPMHFIDISNKITDYIGNKVKVTTIHNELIRNTEFVLIGRGLYALKEWGFKKGTVMDVIIDILNKNKDAMNSESIIEQVLKIRNVKKSTIYMNLQNKNTIKRVGRNYYTLNEKVTN